MIRNKTNTIVIKPRTSSVVIVMLVGLVIVCFVAGVAGAYYFGRWQLQGELAQTRKQFTEQVDRYQVLNEQYEQVQDSVAQMKRQLHIDDSAYTELRKELDQSNLLLGELRSELEFYRSIISPEDGKQGVRVQEFSITPTLESEKFVYKLVLIQSLQQGKELSGTVSLTIKGEAGGEPKTIEHPGPGQEKMQVKFKYFQSLTGTLDLPKTFKPLQVKVDLAGSKKKPLIEERWYPWPQIAGAS